MNELCPIFKIIIERRLFKFILIENILHKKMQEYTEMSLFLDIDR